MPVARKRAAGPVAPTQRSAAPAEEIHDVDEEGAPAKAPVDKGAEAVGAKQSASGKKPRAGDEPRVVVANYNEVERWVRMPCTHFCRRTLRIDA